MRLSIIIGLTLVLAASPSFASEPTGEWLVENGSGKIRIENCGGALWGIVSWEDKPGRDTQNPDPALRGRPTLGIPILLDMKERTVENWGKTEQRWEGRVYNVENGSIYTASIWLTGPNKLRIEGCVLCGLFCGGQEWTRAPQSAATSTVGQARKGSGKAAPKTNAAAVGDVCSHISGVPRGTH